MAAFSIKIFEAAMPALRPLLRNELAWLLKPDERRSSSAFQIMLNQKQVAPDVAGWACGMVMLDWNDPSFVAFVMRDSAEPASFIGAMDAIGTGISAGLDCPVATWKCLELLMRHADPPDALLEAMPVGLVSDDELVRKAALRVMLRRPQDAQPFIEAAQKKKLSPAKAKRLEDALAEVGPSPSMDKSGVLHRLLDAWGKTFDEKLIAPIVAAGAAESTKRGPLKAKTKGALEAAWMQLAKDKDPGDVDRLLGTPWPGAWKLAVARIEALAPFPKDPRIATAVTEQAKRYTSWAGRAVGEAAAHVAGNMKKPRKGDAPAALLKESTKLTPHQGDLDALWKAFWEKPRDEDRRSVLADALQSAGDPRGEFIALQSSDSPDAEKRAAALLKQHIDSWSGALPCVQRASREFRGGFLSAITIKPDGQHLTKAIDRNEWRTVERLGIDYVSIHAKEVGALMKGMPSLRALVFNQRLLDSDEKRFGGRFPGVELIAAPDFFPTKRPEAFPGLQMICVYADPEKALDVAKKAGLRGVMLRSATDLKKALAAFEKRKVSELRIAPSMYSDHEPRGWMIRVTKEKPDQAELFHTGRSENGSFEAIAKVLASHGRTSLRIHGPAALKKKLEPIENATWSHAPFDVFLPPS